MLTLSEFTQQTNTQPKENKVKSFIKKHPVATGLLGIGTTLAAGAAIKHHLNPLNRANRTILKGKHPDYSKLSDKHLDELEEGLHRIKTKNPDHIIESAIKISDEKYNRSGKRNIIAI